MSNIYVIDSLLKAAVYASEYDNMLSEYNNFSPEISSKALRIDSTPHQKHTTISDPVSEDAIRQNTIKARLSVADDAVESLHPSIRDWIKYSIAIETDKYKYLKSLGMPGTKQDYFYGLMSFYMNLPSAIENH